jgi:hypothetical protein
MQVCPHCFNDLEIKSHIESLSSIVGDCQYCSNKSVKLLAIEEILDFFVEFLGVFEANPDGIPLSDKLNNDWNLFSSIEIADNILTEILPLIDSTIKNPKDKVEYITEIIENVNYWNLLKEELKWERRFIQEIEKIKDLGWDSYFNDFVSFSDTEIFYRARIHFNEKENVFKANLMGCPPK